MKRNISYMLALLLYTYILISRDLGPQYPLTILMSFVL